MDYPDAEIVALSAKEATVAVRSAVCPRCASGKGCGAGFLTGDAKVRHVEVPRPTNAVLRVGDIVKLTVEPSALSRASWLAYGMPLCGLLLGALAGHGLSGDTGDGTSIVFAVLGMIAGFLGGRRILRKRQCLRYLAPTIVAAGSST